jgi:hypothetical protein
MKTSSFGSKILPRINTNGHIYILTYEKVRSLENQKFGYAKTCQSSDLLIFLTSKENCIHLCVSVCYFLFFSNRSLRQLPVCFSIFVMRIRDHILWEGRCRGLFVPADRQQVVSEVLLVITFLRATGAIGFQRPES